jgi:uncharacterized protein (TIGR02246 family)
VLDGECGFVRRTATGKPRESAIGNIVTDFEAAWAKCEARSFAPLWTEYGDFLSPFGTFAKGRAEVEKILRRRFPA